MKVISHLLCALHNSLNRSLFGREWSAAQYGLIALTCAAIAVPFGFEAGTAFGAGLIAVTIADTESVEGRWQDPLLMRVGIYAYATVIVVGVAALASAAAIYLASASGFREAGLCAFAYSRILYDTVSFITSAVIWTAMSDNLLTIFAQRLGLRRCPQVR